ncbi:unnamed protein product [Adineta steineri]|uniref:G-protein coupled receptors family 1 profile domain-containing protein n=1 Tax=Adineta steineri TaxID=433720 RepID=A0A819AX08_9BILA|nr:unnamed protein product [Adineta steineri]CAF3791885.1 unnamed protein product [Adineta steineri]
MLSELFYQINFSISIIASLVGIIFNFLLTFIIVNHRKCHTIHNLLVCDLSISSILYLIIHLIGCYYGIRNDWYSYQPFCTLRMYLITTTVAAITYSFLIQAISRLFFSIFYTHTFLLSWRTHYILIIIKWLASFLVAIRPLFIEDSFEVVEEHRMCGIKTHKLPVASYSIILLYIFPKVFVLIVYGLILHQVCQSTHRVGSNRIIKITAACISLNFVRKNLIVLRNMLIILNFLICGGAPYLVLILWDLIENGMAPRELYFVSVNSVIVAIAMLPIFLFYKNKRVRNEAFKYLFKDYVRID